MITLKESLLDDIETTMSNSVKDVAIIDMIFDKDINRRRKGFEELRLLVESYRPKRHNSTNKMKNSDSYFVEFTYQFKIENGLARDICDYMSHIQVFKRTLLSYKTVCINASDDNWSNRIYTLMTTWNYHRQNFNPKASNVKLYEVPKELNGLFERIQMEAEKHK
jgi:hypothetical protein